MTEERLITQTYTIPNHIVCVYDEVIQQKYVKALAEFLCFITHADKNAKLIYCLWAKSIVCTDASENWTFTPNFKYLKDGLYYDKNDDKSNKLRLSLLFDCFYLAEKTSNYYIEKAYIFLSRKTGGYFSKDVLNQVHEFYLGSNNGDNIPTELKNHRKHDYEFQQKKIKKVLVVATMSAGKSTLINALIGNKINKAASMACTNKIRCVHNKYANEGTVLECTDGSIIYTENPKKAQHSSVETVGVHFQSFFSKERICLVDTPGVNYSGNQTHGQMTRKSIDSNDYDILLFVSNATQFLTEDDAKILEYVIKNCKKEMIFCLNQCDSFDPDDDSITETINIWRKLLSENKISNPNLITVSALGALLLKMEQQHAELTKSEQVQIKSIKNDFKDSFYHLEQYCSNRVDKELHKDLLIHTGIYNLETMIKTL